MPLTVTVALKEAAAEISAGGGDGLVSGVVRSIKSTEDGEDVAWSEDWLSENGDDTAPLEGACSTIEAVKMVFAFLLAKGRVSSSSGERARFVLDAMLLGVCL